MRLVASAGRVRRRLVATLVVPLAVGLGLAAIIAATVRQSLQLSDYVARSDRVIADAVRTQKLLVDLETGVRGYLVTGDPVFLQPYEEATHELDSSVSALSDDLARSIGDRSEVDSLARVASEWRAYSRRMIALRQSGGAFSDLAVNLQGKQLMDDLRSRVDALVEHARQRRDARVSGSHTATTAMVIVSVGSVLLFGTFLSAWSYRALVTVAYNYNALEHEIERDQFRVLVDSVRDYAIILLDVDGIIRSWNVGAERIKGYRREEAIGRSFTILYPPEAVVAGLPYELLARARAEGRSEDEGWRMRKDGTRFWAHVVITALRGESGEINGFVKVTRDLTLPRAREHAIVTANEELESFAYSVSHDLRAPLRAIDGFSLALLEDYAALLPADGKKSLQRIRTGAQRMAQLIDDLLRLSRITRADIRKQVVDVTAMCASIVATLREREPSRVVDVKIEPGLQANAEPHLARIVFENLLANAWKFTRHTQGARIEVGRVDHELYVRDNGAGFAATSADRLFQPFKRLHGSDEFEGTGIGLATVHRIVRRHGGHVRGEGTVGSGATFSLEFE